VPGGGGIDAALYVVPTEFLFVLFILLPILSDVAVSLVSERGQFGLASYTMAAGDPAFWTALENTLTCVVLSLFFEVAAGFALAVPSVLLLPLASLLIPITVLLKNLALTNTCLGLIGPFAALGIPFATVILKEAMAMIPDELEEAATIDGASGFTVLVRVTTLLIRSALTVVTIWQFLFSWNEFFLALVIMTKDGMKTLPFAPLYYQGPYMTDPGKLLAILALIAIVPMLIYAVLRRWFVGGLMAGGVKG
jgi:raffinose/stachyose/melibiose transport system permease protein